jgi:hypothetical protein
MTVSISPWSLPIDCLSSTAWLDSPDHIPTSRVSNGEACHTPAWAGRLESPGNCQDTPLHYPPSPRTRNIGNVEQCKRSGTFIEVPPPARLDQASVRGNRPHPHIITPRLLLIPIPATIWSCQCNHITQIMLFYSPPTQYSLKARSLLPSFLCALPPKKIQKKAYNSKCSLVVIHLTTNPPVRCLIRAERTGSLVVSCSTTTKTANMPVCGNEQHANRKKGGLNQHI